MYTSVDKAIAAMVTPVIVGILANVGIEGTMTVAELVQFLVAGAVSSVTVYFATNKKVG